MAALVIFDFDGTVCLGEAPVEAYLREVCARVPDAVARRIEDSYARHLAGTSDAPDGYFAVLDGLDGALEPHELASAYQASRSWLASHPDSVRPPRGLAAFLVRLGELRAERVLLTNSPRRGVLEVLAAHGLDTGFDQVIGDAGKPGTWTAWLRRLSAGRAPQQVLSVGDVYANDCVAPRAAGAATAFVDAHGLHSGPATFTAAELPALYDPILAWITAQTRSEGA